jgi:acetyl-CoA carboxylase carboxyl transferase subunit alpha
MQEFSVYSVIPPEGCAAILWRDAARKVEAAEALRITAKDMLGMKLIDEIVKEPVGGAHQDYDRAATLVDEALQRHLHALESMRSADRLEARYRKFRAMGGAGLGFVEDAAPDEAAEAT